MFFPLTDSETEVFTMLSFLRAGEGSAPRTPGPRLKPAGWPHTRCGTFPVTASTYLFSLTSSGANHSLTRDCCGSNEGTGVQI